MFFFFTAQLETPKKSILSFFNKHLRKKTLTSYFKNTKTNKSRWGQMWDDGEDELRVVNAKNVLNKHMASTWVTKYLSPSVRLSIDDVSHVKISEAKLFKYMNLEAPPWRSPELGFSEPIVSLNTRHTGCVAVAQTTSIYGLWKMVMWRTY